MIEPGKYSKIGLFIEAWQGEPAPSSLELISIAQILNAKLAGEIEALVVGENTEAVARQLILYGVDRVWKMECTGIAPYMEDVFAERLALLVEAAQPDILLGSATPLGRSVFPRVAVKLGTGLTADCTELELDNQQKLVQIRPAMGGNTLARIITPAHYPQMATVRPGVYPLPNPKDYQGEVIPFDGPAKLLSGLALLDEVRYHQGEAANLEAEIVIAAGRGVKTPQNLERIQQFAFGVGAGFGVTRALVDEGWIDYRYQIGLTGKTVAPKVYIACGISGAVQHQIGIRNSGTIVAINQDPQAMIFDYADYGVVGDLFEVLPAVMERLKANRR